jgi:DNA polymerase I-like protein with 3'-5' exonuclease and polymerase domains
VEKLSLRYLGSEKHGAEALWQLRAPMEAKLRELEMMDLYLQAELPLCAVLARMEESGFLVDRKALSDFGDLPRQQRKHHAERKTQSGIDHSLEIFVHTDFLFVG